VVVNRAKKVRSLTDSGGGAMCTIILGTGLEILRGKSAMQIYARNIMALTAASAVLAVGVVTTTPATSDFAAPRIVTTDIVLTGADVGPARPPRPPRPVFDLVFDAAAASSYAVTQGQRRAARGAAHRIERPAAELP